MNFNATMCVCICFFCSSAAQVEWKVSDKVSELREDLKLFCTTNNYSMSSSKAKRWYGGPSQRMLSLNGKPSDLNKYNATVEMHGFGLIIKNVTENDFNVFYKCTYGFDDMTDKLLLKSDAFKVISSDIPKKDVSVTDKDTDSTIIGMALGIPLTIIMVIVFVIAFCVWYKRRPKTKSRTPKTNSGMNSVANIENGTAHLLSNGVHFSNQVTNIIENATAGPDSNGVLFANQEFQQSNKSVTVNTNCTNPSGDSTEEETIPPKAAVTTTPVTQTTQTISSPASFTVPSIQTRLQEVGDNNTEQTDGCPQANIVIENEIQTHGEEDHKCKHLEYKLLKLRKKSFTKPFEPNAEQMALAGFFFLVTGNNDYAECFCCGSKRHWKAGDDPFDVEFHSNCHYIRTMREHKNCTEHKDTDETVLKSI